MTAQVRNERGGKREAYGMTVSAVTDKQISARFERIEQMKSTNGTTGAVSLFALA